MTPLKSFVSGRRSLRLRSALTAIGLAALVAVASAGPQNARDSRIAVGSAPQAPAFQGAIAGHVVSADTGRAVRRARVTVTGGSPRTTKFVQTDEEGGFRISGLPPGDYSVAATKGGFVESLFGQKQPGSGRPGTPITLTANQEVAKLVVSLARGAVVTGTVFDETGEPAFGLTVRASRLVYRSFGRTLEAAGSTQTDDRGIYRIPALLPGEYVVSVAPGGSGGIDLRYVSEGTTYLELVGSLRFGDGAEIRTSAASNRDKSAVNPVPTTALATLYYPGSQVASEATPLLVAPGEERPGVDFHLRVVPVGTIAGTVLGPDGPRPGAGVQLIDQGQFPGVGVRTARAGANGRFTFPGVAPGRYTLVSRATPKGARPLDASAREAAEFLASAKDEAKAAAVAAALSGAAQLWATADIVSDGGATPDVQLALRPGMSISGRVVFAGGGAPPPNLTRMSLTLTPIGPAKTLGDPGMPPAPVDAMGRFTIRGVMPGRYTLGVAAGAPIGYHLQSAVFAGQDVLDFPFDLTGTEPPTGGVVTFSTLTTEMRGLSLDVAGKPLSSVTVIAFAAEDRFWTAGSRRVQAVRPSADGRYVFRNLPPGEYRVALVEDVEPGQWFDPGYLRSLRVFTLQTVR